MRNHRSLVSNLKTRIQGLWHCSSHFFPTIEIRSKSKLISSGTHLHWGMQAVESWKNQRQSKEISRWSKQSANFRCFWLYGETFLFPIDRASQNTASPPAPLMNRTVSINTKLNAKLQRILGKPHFSAVVRTWCFQSNALHFDRYWISCNFGHFYTFCGREIHLKIAN